MPNVVKYPTVNLLTFGILLPTRLSRYRFKKDNNMKLFNFFKKNKIQNNSNAYDASNNSAPSREETIEALGDSMRDELRNIQISNTVNQIDFDTYCRTVISTQYTPLQSKAELELLKANIKDWAANPDLMSESRKNNTTTHFFTSVLSVISYDDIRDQPAVRLLNKLDRFLSEYRLPSLATIMKRRFGADAENQHIELLEREHYKALDHIIKSINDFKLSTFNAQNKGGDDAILSMIMDKTFRNNYENHCRMMITKIGDDNAKLSRYADVYVEFYRNAQTKMAIRQRAVSSLICAGAFAEVSGYIFAQAIETRDNIMFHKWMSLCFPNQWATLLKMEANLTPEQIEKMSDDVADATLDKIKIPVDWHHTIIQQMEGFIQDCADMRAYYMDQAQLFYSTYQTDISICSALSKLVHSAFFDKRLINYLVETHGNTTYFDILETISQGVIYNQRDFNPNVNAKDIALTIEAINNMGEVNNVMIETMERKLEEAQKALQSLKDFQKKKFSPNNTNELENPDDMHHTLMKCYHLALEDTRKATFQHHEEMECYAKEKYARQNSLIINNNEFHKLNLPALPDLVKNNLEQVYNKINNSKLKRIVMRSNVHSGFIRFYEVFMPDEKEAIMHYLIKERVLAPQKQEMDANPLNEIWYDQHTHKAFKPSYILYSKQDDPFYLDFMYNQNNEITGMRIAIYNNFINTSESLLEKNNHNAIPLKLRLFEAEPFPMAWKL